MAQQVKVVKVPLSKALAGFDVPEGWRLFKIEWLEGAVYATIIRSSQ